MIHKLTLEPQPIADQWMASCSCGAWRSTASFYEYDTRDDLVAELERQFVQHSKPHAWDDLFAEFRDRRSQAIF
jgi:hypothetical protein